MSLASMQARNFRGSTSRQRLIDAFIGIGRSLGQINSNETPPDPETGISFNALAEVGPALLDIALNLSVAVDDSKSPPTEFARLITELVEVCTDVIPMTRPVIQNCTKNFRLPRPSNSGHFYYACVPFKVLSHRCCGPSANRYLCQREGWGSRTTMHPKPGPFGGLNYIAGASARLIYCGSKRTTDLG